MQINPNNLIFFYLTGALIAVAFALIFLADAIRSKSKKSSQSSKTTNK